MPIRQITIKLAIVIGVFLLWSGSVHAAILSKPPNNLGLSLYYSFNEGMGDIITDFSGNGNHGTPVNSPSWTTGKLGGGMDFASSSSQYIDTGTGIVGESDVTITFWFKPDLITMPENDLSVIMWEGNSAGNGGGAEQEFNIGTGRNTFDGTQESIYVHVEQNETGGGSPDDIRAGVNSFDDTNVWYHVAVQLENLDSGSPTGTVFVDGEVVGAGADTAAGAIPQGSWDTDLIIGGTANGRHYDGKLDEVRIYNRVLSSTEIRRIRDSGRTVLNSSRTNIVSSGLAGHWTFDGSTIDWGSSPVTFNDVSGSGNIATSTTIASSRASLGKLGQAITFTDATDFIDTNYEPVWDGDDDFSISFWLKLDDTGGDYFFGSETVSAGDDEQIIIDTRTSSPCTSRGIHVFVSDTDNVEEDSLCGEGITVNSWHHAAFTYNVTGDMTLYIDGVYSTSTAVTTRSSGTKDFSGYPFYIGTFNEEGVAGAPGINGKIDDVRVYTREITAGEVQRLYNTRKTSLAKPRMTATLLTQGEAFGTTTSASISPSPDSLILAFTTQADADDRDIAKLVTSTFSVDGAWTEITEGITTSDSISVWYAQTGASPGSGTVTIDSEDTSRTAHAIIEVKGHDTSNPIAQSATSSGSASEGVSLSSLPHKDSLVFGAVGTHDPTASDGFVATSSQGFVEIADENSGGTTDAGLHVHYDAITPGISTTWEEIAGSVPNMMAIIEIAADN